MSGVNDALNNFTLITIAGPTGIGKSDTAVEVARALGCDIISADSRQVYRGIPIGTATPTATQLATVKHHFVSMLELDAYYSAAQFEQDVMRLIGELSKRSRSAVMCGGSMMYVDAVTRGIDELPTITADVRLRAYGILEKEGIDGVLRRLECLDPEYLATADCKNRKRLVHALEICMEAGKPYSSLRTGRVKNRQFRMLNVALAMPREQLFNRINLRVDKMIESGLEAEAASVYNLRHLNSLNTVGYKEMFMVMDGTMERAVAIERIKKNTRVYAKKQMTWLKRRPEFIKVDAGEDAARRIMAMYRESTE